MGGRFLLLSKTVSNITLTFQKGAFNMEQLIPLEMQRKWLSIMSIEEIDYLMDLAAAKDGEEADEVIRRNTIDDGESED